MAHGKSMNNPQMKEMEKDAWKTHLNISKKMQNVQLAQIKIVLKVKFHILILKKVQKHFLRRIRILLYRDFCVQRDKISEPSFLYFKDNLLEKKNVNG